MTVLIGGYSPTCEAGISTYAAGLCDQPSFTSSAVCLKVLCWDHVLFVLYTVELISLIERHGLSLHLYADDTTSRYTARVRLLLWMHFHRR